MAQQLSFNKVKIQIAKILSSYEDNQKWGGSEDSEGALEIAETDFDELKKEINAVLDKYNV